MGLWRSRGRAAAATLVAVCWLGACGDDDNQAPRFLTQPEAQATVYQPYVYEATCADPEGALVQLTLAAEDTCDGSLVDHGDRTASYSFTPEIERADSGCTLAMVCSDGTVETVQQTEITIAGPADIETLEFGPFEPWATPIEDWIDEATIALGRRDFARAIWDLVVFDERLYFGYGDATLNAGSAAPIEIRFWSTPEPDAVGSEYVIDEEMVSGYRVAGDTLMIPGLDATEDALIGNVFTRQRGGAWVKSRTLDHALHIQDVVMMGTTIWACGSGAETWDDYYDGNISGYVYRSDDHGVTFTVDASFIYPSPPGDNRITHLLAVDDQLYAFGYYQDGGTSIVTAFRHTATGLESWTEMPGFLATSTVSLSPGVGLVLGVHVRSPLVRGGVRVTSAGPETATALDGTTPLQAEPMGDGRTLLLWLEGDTHPIPEDGPWMLHVGLTTDGQTITDLVSQEIHDFPHSIAFWRRSLYLGLDDGSVWRAQGSSR